MTIKGSVSSITKIIGDFSDQMTVCMKKNVRRHFREYLLGIMIPPEIRRKSISNISSLVSSYDQSTLNRMIHAVDQEILEKNYITYLKAVIGKHRIQFIGDDTLLNHPGAKVMEDVGWFHDHASGNNVLAHQTVTTMLHDLETDEFYPFLMRFYRKESMIVQDEPHKFRTKLEIMSELFEIASNNFTVSGKTVDSWFSSNRFLGDHYVTELKSNRKVSLVNMRKMTKRNSDMFYTMNELLETTFIMHERNLDILSDFPMYVNMNAWLSNGDPVNIVILYNPENGRKKFLASDYIEGDDLITAWNARWPIETFHNDAKDMGLGEYQVRDSEGSLIHASITVTAYTLLYTIIKRSRELFGKVLKTIGECSRAIKEILFFKKNYKQRLFSG